MLLADGPPDKLADGLAVGLAVRHADGLADWPDDRLAARLIVSSSDASVMPVSAWGVPPSRCTKSCGCSACMLPGVTSCTSPSMHSNVI